MPTDVDIKLFSFALSLVSETPGCKPTYRSLFFLVKWRENPKKTA
jgi:hypothetical protein